MLVHVNGHEGVYIVKNQSHILQYKLDEKGQKTGESLVHIITDSIENSDDRKNVIKKIEEYISI